MNSRPLPKSAPQLGFGGCMPSPRKLKAASVSSEVDSSSGASIRVGAEMFGRICLRKIQEVRAPNILDARTNSRDLSDKVGARATIATRGMERKAVGKMRLCG